MVIQRPVAVGLLLCEQIITEEGTRNVTLVNCFNRRTVSRFPSEPVPLTVYAILTDGLGEMPLDVIVTRLDTLEEIYQRRITGRFTDPLRDVRCVVRIRDCSFPVPGRYEVALWAGDEPVCRRRLSVTTNED